MQFTDKELIDSARRYKSRVRWVANKPLQAAQAKKRGKELYAKCTEHMQHQCHKPTGRKSKFQLLPDEVLMESAKQYSTRKQWRAGAQSLCMTAYKRGKTFYDKCCSHMIRSANTFNMPYVTYVFEFADHRAYVGYTYEPEVRHKTHVRTQGHPVHTHLKICPIFEFKLLTKNLPNIDEACKFELAWFNEYKEAGWTMLNIAKCGGKGGSNARNFVPENVIADAQKYSDLSDWRAHDITQFRYAKNMGKEFMDKCVAHMKSKRVYLSDAKIIELAKKFSTKREWADSQPKLYFYSKYKPDLFKKCTAHMPQKHTYKFYDKYRNATNEEITADAKKYSTKTTGVDLMDLWQEKLVLEAKTSINSAAPIWAKSQQVKFPKN